MNFAVETSRTIISAMIHGRRVTAQDVAWLRREVFGDGEVTRDTADELFAVARARNPGAGLDLSAMNVADPRQLFRKKEL